MAGRKYFTRRFTPYTYDAASLAYFAAFTTPISGISKDVFDRFIVGLKTDRSPSGATSQYQEMVLGRSYMNENRQGARLNIFNPSFAECAEVSTPTWTPQYGYTFNGSSSYLDQNWNESTHGGSLWTANSCGFTLVILNEFVQVNPQLLMGATDAGFNGCSFQVKNGTNQAYAWCNTPYPSAITNPTTIGVFTILKTASGKIDLYRDGVLIGSLTGQGDTALAARNHFTGCVNKNAVATGFTPASIAMELKHSGNVDAGKLFDRIDTFISDFRSL